MVVRRMGKAVAFDAGSCHSHHILSALGPPTPIDRECRQSRPYRSADPPPLRRPSTLCHTASSTRLTKTYHQPNLPPQRRPGTIVTSLPFISNLPPYKHQNQPQPLFYHYHYPALLSPVQFGITTFYLPLY